MAGYLICTSPRSGSTALCSALRSSEVLGWPIEHFNRAYMAKCAVEQHNLATYARTIVQSSGTHATIFASKVFWFQFDSARRRLAPELTLVQTFQMLHERCGHPQIIRLVRQDKLRQAISYARAAKSGVWSMSRTADNPANVLDDSDFIPVGNWLTKLIEWEANWDRLLDVLNIPQTTIRYEDIMNDWLSGVETIAGRLGIKLSSVNRARIMPETARQSDPATDEFVEAFDRWRSKRTLSSAG